TTYLSRVEPAAALDARSLHDALPIWEDRAVTAAAAKAASGTRISVPRSERTAPVCSRWASPAAVEAEGARRWTSPPSLRNLSPRSEEHTSELQSRENLVCRLLLEKKK